MIKSILEIKELPDTTIMVYRSVLNDKTLSLKAKGLHSFMRTMPDNWNFYVVDLENRLKESHGAIARILNELIDKGYVDRDKLPTEKGYFMGYLYVVYPIQKKQYQKYLNEHEGEL